MENFFCLFLCLVYHRFQLCHIRNLRKEDEKYEIWKFGCTNENEPDWDEWTTTVLTTTTLDADPTPTSKPVIIEPGFQIDVL